jgi:outer membrane usher protein
MSTRPCVRERPPRRRRGRFRLARVALSFLLAGLSGPLAALAASEPPLFAPAPAEVIVVRVTLNSEAKGDLFVGRTADLDFLVKPEDLKSMGLLNPAGRTTMLEGEPYLSLRSIRGLSFTFDERTLSLNISAEAKLLPSSEYSLAPRHARALTPSAPSAYFNYAVDASRTEPATPTRLGLSGEGGWRSGNLLLQTNGATVWTADGRRKFVRLQSSATLDDVPNLRQTVAGDFFTQSRDLSTGVNLGGIGVSKVYSLDPYYVRFPTQSITGNVSLPSEMEIYLDGRKIQTQQLKPGEFDLRDIVAFGGAQSVQVVLRDPFGRVQQLSYSFYFSDQPLQPGLHEYSYNLGAIRRQYGQTSNDYGPVAFSIFHRYGLNRYATIGFRAEGTQQLKNVGPLLTLVMGNAGVVNVAVLHSSLAGDAGVAASMAYTYQTRGWNFALSLRHDTRDYAALGDPPMKTSRRNEATIGGSYQVPGNGTLSLTHTFLTVRDDVSALPAGPGAPFAVLPLSPRKATTLGYTAPLLSGRVSFMATISHIHDQVRGSRNEAFVGLTFLLDKDHSLATSMRRDPEAHAESLRLVKSQPIGEGVGYAIGLDRSSDFNGTSSIADSSVQYNASAAMLRAEYNRSRAQQGGTDDYHVSVAGNVSYVGGQTAFGRPVTGSFGIARVAQVPDVQVLLEGQPIGRTDRHGNVFLPTLNPYFDNEVSVDPATVPLEYSLEVMKRKVSPPMRGGILVDFGATKMQAFTGTLQAASSGKLAPVAFGDAVLHVDGKPLSFLTGRTGEFYLEKLKPGRYLGSVALDGQPCTFELTVPVSNEMFVDLKTVTCRMASP